MKINNNIISKCHYNYVNDKYDFKDNIDIFQLMISYKSKLQKNNIEIIHQIINYDNKVIGIFVKYQKYDEKIFIPLKPSGIYPDYDYELVHDEIWNSYINTKQILREIHDLMPFIECRPRYKIIEDLMIVGIITDSNQFVKINEIIPNIKEDDLKELSGFDESYINKELINYNETHYQTKQQLIHFMKLEKDFYISYINNLKIIIHDKSNIDLKKNIEKIINNIKTEELEILYQNLYEIIQKLTLENFEFTAYKDEELMQLYDIELCNEKDSKNIYCVFKEDKNKLMLPIKNLYTREDNLEKYVSNFTHDLLFNNNFKTKILENIQTIVNDNISFKLNELSISEILSIQESP